MRKRSEAGITLMLGMLSLLFIIPVMGLAIDVGFLYISKSKLQAAVDGASLAAARSLNVGSSTASQSAAAQANAVNWFYANYPSNFFGSTGTVMTTSSVTVADDPNNAHLRNVTVNATTNVATFFMKWLGFNATSIGALGKASRRDVVIMMVLDRSGSMCAGASAATGPCAKGSKTTAGNPTPCDSMISAAKLFTGQFAEGRDAIGLISFSDNVYVHSQPVTTFQTVLGYTNDSGNGVGDIDSLGCYGGTGTAQAVSLGYQMLYQMNEPGALNVVFLETDGLPNTLTMNFYDSVNNQVGLTNSGTASTCTDLSTPTPKTYKNGGFGSASVIPKWTQGLRLTQSPFSGATGFYSDIPAGMIGAIPSSDPGSTNDFWVMNFFWTVPTTATTQTENTGSASNPFNAFPNYINTATGCSFNASSPPPNGSGYFGTSPTDFAWFPATDVYGNSTNPSSPASAYKSVPTDSNGHVTPVSWSNYHNAVLNATDNAAFRARANSTIGASFFVIGLAGNSAVPPDPILLQRIANDPNGDTFNTSGPDNGGYYWPCAQETGCVTYASPQPQGTFIYAPNSSSLAEAFLRISSQVLRISK